MARITLQYPDQLFIFSTLLPVRVSDVNAGNHLGNDKMATLISEARDAFWVQRMGFNEDSGSIVNTLVTDQVIVYRAESRVREVLRFEVGITELNKYGGDFIYRITREPDGKPIADAKTGFVFFDKHTGKVVPIPDWFHQRLQARAC